MQVAIPLVALARTMGYETVVVDGRPAFATRSAFPTSTLAGRLADEVAEHRSWAETRGRPDP